MITIKSQEEIETMAEAGKILSGIMRELKKNVRSGISTEKLDRLAESLIIKSAGQCSFKGYHGFPNCLCVSINEEIVHGLPSDRIIKKGDIISLDLGIFYKGYHSDMAITVGLGNIKPEARRLIRVTKKVLKLAIKKIKPGIKLGDVSNTIQRYAESQGFNVVRDLCGHGIGKELHEDPKILNYGKRRTGPELVEGMVFCLEPMITAGDWKIEKTKDGFGYKTKDDSLSCHFEQTIAITSGKCRVLTEI